MVNRPKNPGTLRGALTGKLSKEELMLLRGSFDVIGDIAVVEIPEGLEKKEKLIAKTLLGMHRQIKVVCKKIGGHSGIYRRQKMRILAGQKRKETEYRENSVRIRLHVESCYFSPRLSDERKRVAGLVKPGERVLVMFSGVAPYPLVISKNSKAYLVVGIEKNPSAHGYAVENVRLNKAANVQLFLGDVREVLPKIVKSQGRFDRIVMPLPKGGADFLGLALSAGKRGAVVHFYDFLHEDELVKAGQKAASACKEHGIRCRIQGTRKCGSQSPRTYRVVVDFIAG